MENSLANTSDMSTMSMYFDAESTMSSVAFKTLDTSEISFIDDAPVASQNSTLNANDENAYSVKQLKNVMKPNVNASPLRPYNRISFQGFNGLSSTPGKVQIVKRRSEVGLGIDIARMEINDAAIVVAEENKESVMNSESEASTLSASSCVETTMNSTMENKIPNMTINNNDNDVGEHSTDDASTPRIDDLIKDGQNDSTNTLRTSVGSLMKEISKEVNEIKLLVNGTNVKLNEENMMPKIVEISDDENDETAEKADILKPIEKDIQLKYSAKKNLPKPSRLSVPRRSLIAPQTNRNIRKSICEPNLKTNRPSRIATSVNAANKRNSLLPKRAVPDIQKDSDAEPELTELLDKMMKMSNKNDNDGIRSKYPSHIRPKANSSDGGQKARFTLAPTLSTHTEKRLFNKRLSAAAKTTQNSPGRRVQRKSGAINIGQTRKSFAAQQGAGGDNTDFKSISSALLQKSLAGGRKSFMPGIRENASKTRQSVAKSSFARDALKTMEARLAAGGLAKPKQIAVPQSKKPDLPFSCSICGNKYRIKSLLDAHKRIHENDTAPPYGRKVSPATSVSHLSNQCKYCDKKFALVRALHIHLMQNCPKIPPSEKRKLRYTEMDHVEKAKIPVFNTSTNSTNSANNSANNATIVNLKAMQKPYQAYNTAGISSDESLSDRRDYPPYENKRMAPPPPKSTKSKKNAHSGVRRTPNKSLACHLYGDGDSATSDNP